MQVPADLVKLAKQSHLFSDESVKAEEETGATTPRMDSTLGRKAELDSLVKASEQFTKAMKQSGVSQATLMVRMSTPLTPTPPKCADGVGLGGEAGFYSFPLCGSHTSMFFAPLVWAHSMVLGGANNNGIFGGFLTWRGSWQNPYWGLGSHTKRAIYSRAGMPSSLFPIVRPD